MLLEEKKAGKIHRKREVKLSEESTGRNACIGREKQDVWAQPDNVVICTTQGYGITALSGAGCGLRRPHLFAAGVFHFG